MTLTTEVDQPDHDLIKTDCIGRIKIKPKHREKLLDAYEHSGMSALKFAAHHGLKYQTFACWLQKRKKARSEYPATYPAPPSALLNSLAEVSLTPPATDNNAATSLTVELPGGAKLHITNPEQSRLAADLINNLIR